MRRPPVCPTCRRNPHAQWCPATRLREEARYAADILEKWGAVMCKRWAQILSTMEYFKISMHSNLMIEEYAVLDMYRLYLNIQGALVTPKEALENKHFDKSILPRIRHFVIKALGEYENRIKEAKAILEREVTPPKLSARSKNENITDELGADILQYGGFPK